MKSHVMSMILSKFTSNLVMPTESGNWIKNVAPREVYEAWLNDMCLIEGRSTKKKYWVLALHFDFYTTNVSHLLVFIILT